MRRRQGARSGAGAVALAILFVLTGSQAARAELHVWVDAEGHTHVRDEPPPGGVSPPAPASGSGAGLWDGRIVGPVRADAPAWGVPSRLEDARLRRLLRSAVDDLRRGEIARATGTLESVLALDPGRPEAHWYLALLARQRGRFEASAEHLRAFLAHAGDAFASWRESARRRLAALEDERRLADAAIGEDPLRLAEVSSPRFRVRYDERLEVASADYPRTVLRYLEEAFAFGEERLGLVPREPTRVVLYAKAAYVAEHRHRFSFPTVGFYDGRIHVVSAAHPAGELRALLFHEYTHALFREQTGSDRPFWLNEGLARLAERVSRSQEVVTRSERARLHRVIEAGQWIPLRRLETGFAGLDEAAARLAYLEATAAAAWLETRLAPPDRSRLLAELGRGRPVDGVLRELLGLDTEGVDAALRLALQAEFPSASF